MWKQVKDQKHEEKTVQSPMMCVVLRKKEKLLKLFLESEVDNVQVLCDASNCLLLRAANSRFYEGIHLLFAYGFNDLDLQKKNLPDREEENEAEDEDDSKDEHSETKQFETLMSEDATLKQVVQDAIHCHRKPRMIQLALAMQFDPHSSLGQVTGHPCYERQVVKEILKMMTHKKLSKAS